MGGVLDKLDRINDICLFVKDFEGSIKFFTEKFALKRLPPDSDNIYYARFDFCGTILTLWDKQNVREVIDHKYIDGEGHHFMIAIKVSDAQDVDDVHRALTHNGVVCIKPPEDYPFGTRSSYFLDHEKNIWEVFAWHYKQSGQIG
jgi:catechol 2,3-dioxygenase-like lactoylglutathione lyase family enzyme